MVKITECPRDAMQGIHDFIPTEIKAEYLNKLLKVGFNRLDFGSFVSPKAIPQMRDTADVLKMLRMDHTETELLAIIANQRGAEDACAFSEIRFLGFPFSISETFQQRNANAGIDESFARVEAIQALCEQHGKKLLIYISMAFGNPYGDRWDPSIAIKWSQKMKQIGIRHIALADTVGSADPAGIRELFTALLPELSGVEVCAHLHSTKENAAEKIRSAYESGCRSFDAAIHGFGGCPMAKDELTGNIATEDIVAFAEENAIGLPLDRTELESAYAMAWNIFNKYH